MLRFPTPHWRDVIFDAGPNPTTSNIGVSFHFISDISFHHTPRPHTLHRVIRNLMCLAHI